jgi:hypothetical protein
MNNTNHTNQPQENTVETKPMRIKQLMKMMTHPEQSVKDKANKELTYIAYGTKEQSPGQLGFSILVTNLARQVLTHGFIPQEYNILIK